MGEVVDLVKYREQLKPNQRSGYSMETRPPFIIVRHWEDGQLREECRHMSEYLLREMIDAAN